MLWLSVYILYAIRILKSFFYGFQNKKKIARAKKELELKARGVDFAKVNNEEDNLFDEGDDDLLF